MWLFREQLAATRMKASEWEMKSDGTDINTTLGGSGHCSHGGQEARAEWLQQGQMAATWTEKVLWQIQQQQQQQGALQCTLGITDQGASTTLPPHPPGTGGTAAF